MNVLSVLHPLSSVYIYIYIVGLPRIRVLKYEMRMRITIETEKSREMHPIQSKAGPSASLVLIVSYSPLKCPPRSFKLPLNCGVAG